MFSHQSISNVNAGMQPADRLSKQTFLTACIRVYHKDQLVHVRDRDENANLWRFPINPTAQTNWKHTIWYISRGRILGGTRHGHEICRQIHHRKTWRSYVAPYHISNIWLLEPNSLFILTWMLKATRSPSDFWPPLPSNAGKREGALLPNPSKLKLRHASSTGLYIGLEVLPPPDVFKRGLL